MRIKKKQVFITFGIIISILIINFFLLDNSLAYFVSSFRYYQKASTNRVSHKFHMDVTRKSIDGKSYTYYGVERGSKKEKYIVLSFADKLYHEVYAEDGITINEAIMIAEKKGYTVNYSNLILMSSFTPHMSEDHDNIQSHLN